MAESDAWIIGLVVVLICFASAIVGWDPRILLNEPGSDIVVEPGGDKPEAKELAASLQLNVSSINWGVVEPGGSAERGLLIENNGTGSGVLSVNTGNWVPSAAQEFINFSWSLAPGFVLAASSSISCVLRLDVSPKIQNITDFSFDITIYVSEVSAST